jgi:hypothetical protein
MKTTRSFAALAAALGSLAALGCQTASSPPSAATTTAAAPTPMPSPAAPAVAHAEHIKLQHILIAFAGKVPGKNITRSQDEARALANQVFERAKKGEDFDSLVRTYTDDRAPGTYSLSNSGVAPAAGEFSRDRMVPAFGNVGFSLAPGEIGMAEYDPRTSPYGWHIIKRLE